MSSPGESAQGLEAPAYKAAYGREKRILPLKYLNKTARIREQVCGEEANGEQATREQAIGEEATGERATDATGNLMNGLPAKTWNS